MADFTITKTPKKIDVECALGFSTLDTVYYAIGSEAIDLTKVKPSRLYSNTPIINTIWVWTYNDDILADKRDNV